MFFLDHDLDVQREGDLYTATVCCDWPTPHGIVYNLQYSYDEQYLYSIGKNDEFLLQSKLFISNSPGATPSTSNPPETTSLKIKGGAVSTVQENTDETLPICGQFFCFMPRKNYFLTSSCSQGIVYKVRGGNWLYVHVVMSYYVTLGEKVLENFISSRHGPEEVQEGRYENAQADCQM